MDEGLQSGSSWKIFTQLSENDLRELIKSLKSPLEDRRRQAIQSIVALEDSPIQHIVCWPEMKCTRLQLFVAEMIILEWLKLLRRNPEANEADVINELFPEEEDLTSLPAPRYRALAKPSPTAQSSAAHPSRLAVALNRLSDTVKDSILDFTIGPEPNEFTAANSEDIPLQPLDRKAFEERMRPRVDDAIEAAAEVLSKPMTDRELACCSEQLGKVADSFRWNALEVAMELRTAAEACESDTKKTHTESGPKSWAQKFRLMRASGF